MKIAMLLKKGPNFGVVNQVDSTFIQGGKERQSFLHWLWFLWGAGMGYLLVRILQSIFY